MPNVQTGILQRAVIYTRVSGSDQCCERQERDLRALCERRNYKVVTVLKEKASGALSGRRQRRKAMHKAKSGECDVIVVTELSRWGRSLKDLMDTVDHLREWGCDIVIANMPQLDTTVPMGRLLFQVTGAIAEFERELTVERIKSSLALRKHKAKEAGIKPNLGGRKPGKSKAYHSTGSSR